jgi:hypothetical protein
VVAWTAAVVEGAPPPAAVVVVEALVVDVVVDPLLDASSFELFPHAESATNSRTAALAAARDPHLDCMAGNPTTRRPAAPAWPPAS